MLLFLSRDWSSLCLMKLVHSLCMCCASFCSFLECPREWWLLVMFGCLNLDWMQNIKILLKRSYYEIWQIPVDGLCVLRSFKVCMEAATGQSILLEDIKPKLKKKMCWNYYSTFRSNVDISNEVEKFLYLIPYAVVIVKYVMCSC